MNAATISTDRIRGGSMQGAVLALFVAVLIGWSAPAIGAEKATLVLQINGQEVRSEVVVEGLPAPAVTLGASGDNPAAAARAGSVLEEIEIEKEIDRSSVPLVQAYQSRQFLTRVGLQMHPIGAAPRMVVLRGVRIKSYQIISAGTDRPTSPGKERFTLTFEGIQQ
jgi:hypothetical protein